jgi:hypothetical protein
MVQENTHCMHNKERELLQLLISVSAHVGVCVNLSVCIIFMTVKIRDYFAGNKLCFITLINRVFRIFIYNVYTD